MTMLFLPVGFSEKDDRYRGAGQKNRQCVNELASDLQLCLANQLRG